MSLHRVVSRRRGLSILREFCPPLLPVRVYLRELKDCWGYTTLRWEGDRPIRFVIVLHRGMTKLEEQTVLMHEWAHCLAWREGHATVCDHDPEWALALSQVYQEFVEP